MYSILFYSILFYSITPTSRFIDAGVIERHLCSLEENFNIFYQVPFLQDFFKTVKPEVILDFLKAAALYRLL